MIILSVDSSAVSASVALFDGEKIIGEFIVNAGLTHSRTLMPVVDSLLKNTDTKIENIDAFAVSTGPGSFTGLRIAIAAIKGLALSLNKPCIEVSTLEAIAYNGVGLVDGVISAVMDARCNQVYNALFKWDGTELIRLVEDRAISITELEEELLSAEKVYLIGDGTKVALNGMERIRDKITVLSPSQTYQKASSVAELAYKKYLLGDTLSHLDLRPVYLRMPQAERELNNRLNNKKTEEN